MKISDPLGKVYTHTMFKNGGAKQLHKRYEGVAAAGLEEDSGDSGDSGGDADGDVAHTVADHHRIMGRNQFLIYLLPYMRVLRTLFVTRFLNGDTLPT